MTVREAITLFGYHQRADLKSRTVQSYHPLLQMKSVSTNPRLVSLVNYGHTFGTGENKLSAISYSLQRRKTLAG